MTWRSCSVWHNLKAYILFLFLFNSTKSPENWILHLFTIIFMKIVYVLRTNDICQMTRQIVNQLHSEGRLVSLYISFNKKSYCHLGNSLLNNILAKEYFFSYILFISKFSLQALFFHVRIWMTNFNVQHDNFQYIPV